MNRAQKAVLVSWFSIPVALAAVWAGPPELVLIAGLPACARDLVTNHKQTFSAFIAKHNVGCSLALIVTGAVLALIVEALFTTSPLLGHAPGPREAALIMIPFFALLLWHDIEFWPELRYVPRAKEAQQGVPADGSRPAGEPRR